MGELSSDGYNMLVKTLKYLAIYKKKKRRGLLISELVQPYYYVVGEIEIQIGEILLN